MVDRAIPKVLIVYTGDYERLEKQLGGRLTTDVRSKMIDCEDCEGSGQIEGPVRCNGRCDWCGGCVEMEMCRTCDGYGEVQELCGCGELYEDCEGIC